MQRRSLGIIGLSVLSVMVGLYGTMAGVALLFGGAIGAYEGSPLGNLSFGLGMAFVVLTIAAYIAAGGLWLQVRWSWALSAGVFGSLVVLNLMLSSMADNFINTLIPVVGAVIALWYLSWPQTRARLLSDEAPTTQAAPSRSTTTVAKTLA